MTQVLIVEDQKMIRESLENLVAQADDLSPAGSLSCAWQYRPDINGRMHGKR